MGPSGGGGGGGGGYSGAASVSTSATQGYQQNFAGQNQFNNSTGFQLPKWAVPVAIVLGFVFAIVWLVRKT